MTFLASSSKLKTVYLDDAYWIELATARGIKLPNHVIAPTQIKVTLWLTKLGISHKQFANWCGYKNPAEWIAKNPTFSLRALVGLLIEELDDPRGSLCFNKSSTA